MLWQISDSRRPDSQGTCVLLKLCSPNQDLSNPIEVLYKRGMPLTIPPRSSTRSFGPSSDGYNRYSLLPSTCKDKHCLISLNRVHVGKCVCCPVTRIYRNQTMYQLFMAASQNGKNKRHCVLCFSCFVASTITRRKVTPCHIATLNILSVCTLLLEGFAKIVIVLHVI